MILPKKALAGFWSVVCASLPSSHSFHYSFHQHVRFRPGTPALISTRATESTSAESAVSPSKHWKTFEDWAKGSGIKFDGLKHVDFDYMGESAPGVKADVDIPERKRLVFVPKDRTISATPSEDCPFPDWVDGDFWNRQPLYMRLALKLLWERKLGSQSKMEGYIKSLPEPDSFNTLQHWSAEELEYLRDPILIETVQAQQGTWKDTYNELTLFSPDGAGKDLTEEDLVWALDCVLSRSFTGSFGALDRPIILAESAAVVASLIWYFITEQDLALVLGVIGLGLVYYSTQQEKEVEQSMVMVPVVGSINHLTEVQTNIGFDWLQNGLTLSVDRDFRVGEQVFISYGARSNDELLRFFGFIEPNNPAASVTFNLLGENNALERGLLLTASQQNLLLALDSETKKTLTEVTVRQSGEIDDLPKVIAALDKLLNSSSTCSDPDTRPPTKELVLQMLNDACQNAVQYTSYGQDASDMVKLEPKNAREKLANQLKDEKLKVMRECLQAWKNFSI